MTVPISKTQQRICDKFGLQAQAPEPMVALAIGGVNPAQDQHHAIAVDLHARPGIFVEQTADRRFRHQRHPL